MYVEILCKFFESQRKFIVYFFQHAAAFLQRKWEIEMDKMSFSSLFAFVWRELSKLWRNAWKWTIKRRKKEIE